MAEVRSRGQARRKGAGGDGGGYPTPSSPERVSISETNAEKLVGPHVSHPIISPTSAFSILLVVRLLSAVYATIPDCDEVFNYWEPAHYLTHGYGLQTWEYSPVYAIRSWAYVGLHAIATRAISLVPQLEKTYEFYGLRCLFAVFCAYSEKRLYAVVSSSINPRVGILYLVLTIGSAGMFHAAAAFLPSTFAMYTTMLAMASFMDRRWGSRSVQGVVWFAVGGLLGWPFSMAMCIPFVLEEIFVGCIAWDLVPTLLRLAKGGAVSLILLASIVGVDYLAYRKLEIVPLNIVLYNVFSGAGKGPNVYGTEPWWFYLANLTLNFNILLPLALASYPLLILYYLACRSVAIGVTPRMASISLPFYLWLAVFTTQPHKEERFMFVAYPALCINAAVSYHIILTVWGGLSGRLTNGKAREFLDRTVIVAPLSLAMIASIGRILAVTSGYSAPLHVYSVLPSDAQGYLCLAKEWYRFPSSYFLPDGIRVKFVKSAFDGLLPGEFPETGDPWSRPGTWMIPSGMNDENKGDPSKYVSLELCDYMVESYFSRPVEEFEADYALDQGQWESVYCENFLDSTQTGMLGRTLWVPSWVPVKKSWGRYCLLKRAAR
ncbi:unnamed protein product [Tuber melanosporum]|uniref:Mannosyltransferase n=1 Tax=Tuber melanosporum (strain Mel28) TaxID=656061 RepID=D5GF10_TUBMM|nr:uncharacterized protein GSTUM_00006689001 [Tuber melanosporum]CAZ83103.1 unnamed protein product [Tuber melanosporum]